MSEFEQLKATETTISDSPKNSELLGNINESRSFAKKGIATALASSAMVFGIGHKNVSNAENYVNQNALNRIQQAYETGITKYPDADQYWEGNWLKWGHSVAVNSDCGVGTNGLKKIILDINNNNLRKIKITTYRETINYIGNEKDIPANCDLATVPDQRIRLMTKNKKNDLICMPGVKATKMLSRFESKDAMSMNVERRKNVTVLETTKKINPNWLKKGKLFIEYASQRKMRDDRLWIYDYEKKQDSTYGGLIYGPIKNTRPKQYNKPNKQYVAVNNGKYFKTD